MSQEVKIALLGFTQTGKTCIAANFANKNGYSGIDEYSRNFLRDNGEKITKMRAGDMSDVFPATNPGKPDVLRFRDNESGNIFAFEEYSGEMLTKDGGLIDKLDIPNRDGVLLLLSAREPIYNDKKETPEQRIHNIKEAFADVVTELVRKPKPIIFVITAADVLLDNRVDHSCFFELKKHIEERIKRNKLKIADTQFVTIIEEHQKKKIFDQNRQEIGIIVPAEKAVTDLLEDISQKENERKKKMKKIFLFAFLLIIIAVAVAFFVFRSKKCEIRGVKIEEGYTKCGSCLSKNEEELADYEKTLHEKLQNPKYDSKEYFDDLNKFCRDITHSDNKFIKDAKIFKFATKYVEWHKSKITIKITDINFKKAPDAKGVVRLDECFLQTDRRAENTVEIYQEATEKESHFPVNSSITIKPWDTPKLWIGWRRKPHYTPDAAGKWHTTSVPFNPHTPTGFDCATSMNGFAYLKVTVKIDNGKTFPELLNHIFGTPKPDLDAIRDSED